MFDPEEAIELVRRDVELGMADWLIADPGLDAAGFRLLDSFADDAAFVGPETGSVAVPWVWVGRHGGVGMGLAPTGNVVEVRGLTVVRDDDGTPTFTRFVDWVSALAGMGVGLFSRPVVDESAGLEL